MAMRFLYRYLVFSLCLTSFLLISGATYLTIQDPISTQLYQNGSISLGKVAPGQSFSIVASSTTTNDSGVILTDGWDTLKAIQLPPGWTSQPSPSYANPMKMKITVIAEAANGTYPMVIEAVNYYGKVDNLTFNAYMNVTPNVLNSSVSSTQLVAGVGQPTNIRVTINNTGASDDPFVINASGLPAWDLPISVIAAHSTTNTYLYPVFVNEPGVYKFNFTIDSATSPLVHRTYPMVLTVQSSLLNDYSATGQGVILSPVIYEPVYAFMQLINYLYRLVFS